MPNSSKYLEQFERVKRWYKRFEIIDQGKPHDQSSEYYQDDVYAFFLNCYHLKEWIINDKTIGLDKTKVEDFISKNESLRLCADICNSIKHLKLKNPRSNQNPQFGNKFFRVGLGSSETSISVKYSIDTSSGKIDSYELATSCIQAWENFIATNINDDKKY